MTDAPLPPGSVIGILGGGQLGRMLTIAAARLGLKTHVLSDRNEDPAYDVARAFFKAEFSDEAAIATFAETCDAVTFEFENVPPSALETAAAHAPARPSSAVLAITQDRLSEKEFISQLGIPTARFAAVSHEGELDAALDETGLPALIKTRRFGYDGKGQHKIMRADEARQAFNDLGGAPCIVESFLDFAREISVIAVRGGSGEIAFYDAAENDHREGILRTSRVPAGILPGDAGAAQDITARICHALDHVGVLCVELFHMPHVRHGPLVVNEIAPRVHNSGHWTLDACGISQFENHIRAVAGWPLGATERHSDAVMTNLIGTEAEDWAELAADSGAIVHLYGKRDTVPGRKMGHVTRLYPKT